jgi:hypothetical protein
MSLARPLRGRAIVGGVHEGFWITFRRDTLAETLWEYGEDKLAEKALRLSESQLKRVQRLAVWHHLHDPHPAEGPKLSNGRIMARAMIDFAELRARDTKRTRRRTRPQEQRYDAAYLASLEGEGKVLPSTRAELGERRGILDRLW